MFNKKFILLFCIGVLMIGVGGCGYQKEVTNKEKDYEELTKDEVEPEILEQIQKEVPEGYEIDQIIATDIEKNDIEGYQNLIVNTGLAVRSPDVGNLSFEHKILFFSKDNENQLALIKDQSDRSSRGLDIEIIDMNGDGSKEMISRARGGVRVNVLMENIISGEKFVTKGGENTDKEVARCGYDDMHTFFIKDFDQNGIFEYAITEEVWRWGEESVPVWEIYEWDGKNYVFDRKKKRSLDDLREKYGDIDFDCPF